MRPGMNAVSLPSSQAPAQPLHSVAEALFAEGQYAAAADMLLDAVRTGELTAAEFSLLARALANQGRLTEALAWCDRWVAEQKLEPRAHYLRATVLIEQGEPAQARGALQRAVFLSPDFVLAHYALGTVARQRGNHVEATRHLRNALELLRAHDPIALLPEGDGLTAGRLAEIVAATVTVESTQ